MDDPKQPKKESLLASPARWLVAAVIGLGSGLAGAIATVQREFYSNIRKFPEIENVARPAYDEAIKKIKEERIAGTIDGKTFRQRYKAEKDIFEGVVDTLSESLGIRSKGIGGYLEGSLQRFGTLSTHSRVPVAFNAITATVIGFAGTSMFFNSLSTHKHIKHLDETLKAKEPQR